MTKPAIHESWLKVLENEFEQLYMQQLRTFLTTEKAAKQVILPPSNLTFNALQSTPLDHVKVVILGQDPYPTVGHAHGLCFSVNPEVKPLPKSLLNLNKELQEDLNINNFHTGYLQPWAEQGVLLLNAVLTVRASSAGSHQKQGWEQFTDKIIQILNEQQGIVFILWGKQAQMKGKIIDRSRHLVLQSVHPSPLSAYRGFFGSKPFSKTNDYLRQQDKTEIHWQL